MVLMITYIKKLSCRDITKNDVYELLQRAIIQNKLCKYVEFVIFYDEVNSVYSSDATSYNKYDKTLSVDFNRICSLNINVKNGDSDVLMYNRMTLLNEIFLGIEKIKIEHLDHNMDQMELLKIKSAIKEYQDSFSLDDSKYFDEGDDDIKVFSKDTLNNVIRTKKNTISPIERYIKVKAMLDTIDLFKKICPNSKAIEWFKISNADVLANGYYRDKNIILYPLLSYFSQKNNKDEERYLDRFDWYHNDYLETLSSASKKYNYENRLMYGMPIDTCEYHLVRKYLDE